MAASLTPHTHVISAELACSPCLNALNNRVTACADNQCMKRIWVDTVLEKATEVIGKRRNVTAELADASVRKLTGAGRLSRTRLKYFAQKSLAFTVRR